MDIIKEKTAAFTGHRPEKLPGYEEDHSAVLSAIKSMLYYQIYQSVEQGYEYFITGVARGVDLWAAEYVMDIRRKFHNIKLICAVPFNGYKDRFKGYDLWILENVLYAADDVIVVSENYSRDCYKRRNYFMVDNSSRLIAVVNEYKSGTGQTINYAKKKGLDIHIINVNEFTAVAPKRKPRKSGYFYLD